MILDTSVVVGILLREAGHEILQAKVTSSSTVGIGAPTLTEAGIVLNARDVPRPRSTLLGFLLESQAVVVPFGRAHWTVALDAYERYGGGRHPARLNLGDCFSYATAKVARRPLLFVGDGFSQTDIEPA